MDRKQAAEIITAALPHQGSQLMEALCVAGLAGLGAPVPATKAAEPKAEAKGKKK